MSESVAAVQWVGLDSRRVRAWVGLLMVEGLALASYFAISPDQIGELRYAIYPFVWINVGLWAVLHTSPSPRNRQHRLLGIGISMAYFLVVMAIPGKIALGTATTPTTLRIGWYVPGWGPLIAVQSPWIRLFLVPFEVVGYASLTYLVYANVLQYTRGTVTGALGLVTCIGCTVPIAAPLVGLLGGPATSLTTTAYSWSYDIGTLVYLITVLLLYGSHNRRLPWR